jgi:hypothetical protein
VPDVNAAGSDNGQDPPRNTIDNVRNVLGFLLAGFGAVLTFLGVRSSEVTTVLRNDTLQASLIALVLLLGVLAAVTAVVSGSGQAISLPGVVAVITVLCGLAAIVVFFIPINAGLISVSGDVSLAAGCILMLAGIVTLILYRPFLAGAAGATNEGSGAGDPRKAGTSRGSTDPSGRQPGAWRKQWPESFLKWSIQLVDLLIVAAVVLIGIAAYGAMRLETKSQLSFSAQVGASFSINGPIATVSVNVAAARIVQTDWIVVYVYALPAKVDLTATCASLYRNFQISKANAPCATDPCLYFTQGKYATPLKTTCATLLNGTIVPNATGNVNETLSLPFLAAKYQDIDVRAEICTLSQTFCEDSKIGQNSRLDWVVPNSAAGTG